MKRSSFSRGIAVVILAALFALAVGQLSASADKAPDVVETHDQATTARATISPHGALVEWTSEFDNRIHRRRTARLAESEPDSRSHDGLRRPGSEFCMVRSCRHV